MKGSCPSSKGRSGVCDVLKRADLGKAFSLFLGWKSGLVFPSISCTGRVRLSTSHPLPRQQSEKKGADRMYLSPTLLVQEFPHQLNGESAYPVHSNEAACSAVSSPPCWRRQQARKKMARDARSSLPSHTKGHGRQNGLHYSWPHRQAQPQGTLGSVTWVQGLPQNRAGRE